MLKPHGADYFSLFFFCAQHEGVNYNFMSGNFLVIKLQERETTVEFTVVGLRSSLVSVTVRLRLFGKQFTLSDTFEQCYQQGRPAFFILPFVSYGTRRRQSQTSRHIRAILLTLHCKNIVTLKKERRVQADVRLYPKFARDRIAFGSVCTEAKVLKGALHWTMDWAMHQKQCAAFGCPAMRRLLPSARVSPRVDWPARRLLIIRRPVQ